MGALNLKRDIVGNSQNSTKDPTWKGYAIINHNKIYISFTEMEATFMS